MEATIGQARNLTWIPFYEELAGHLLKYRERQRELIAFLADLRARGLKITPLEDKDVTGRRFLLEEIDPFTFFSTFNRGITIDNRIAILREIKTFFDVTAALPSDFSGIPVANNQSSWFFSYRPHRQPDDVPRLWDVFAAAQRPDALNDAEFANAFDRALQIRGVNVNLTMGLFWIRPSVFISLDGKMRDHLGLKLPRGGLSSQPYRKMVADVRSRASSSIAQLSHEAWEAAETSETSTDDSNDAEYWMVGAYWDSADQPDQTDRFLKEGVWENGYEDRYLDQVRSMKVGDRIAIKAASTQRNGLPFDARGDTVSRMSIKAIGTIVHNPGDGRTVEVEWNTLHKQRDWYFYTARLTIWRLRKEDPYARRLIDFVFHSKPQDYAFFVKEWGRLGKGDVDVPADFVPYAIADVIAEGVFMTEPEIEAALRRLRAKKNLILQGAPGVGKTFVARKLAYALMESRDDARVTLVQFHPSYSYEDFVRGYRPTGTAGGFELRDGPFLRAAQRAGDDPDRIHVLIIDEINRGNLSQVFGELFMLLEADKRGSAHRVAPLYRRTDDETMEVPSNLYVVGTMNIADRSLALVDFALRRRFAFLTLEPRFGQQDFRRWLTERKMSAPLIDRIVQRMGALNQQIASDSQLGPAFRVGHSFFCPRGDDFSAYGDDWYSEVVATEIAPLLHEYWYDEPATADTACESLLAQ